ncbi:MAG: murein hydrolase activator EnvC family protein [Longimicrobiales bacterium]
MRRAALVAGFLVALTGGAPAGAQDIRDIRASQLRLDSIRQERRRLQEELESLQSRVRDASREVVNIGRQRVASASALQELEFQAALLSSQVDETTTRLTTTHDALDDRKNALRGRLRSIYKRGPLHSVRVLLSAESFGDLLNRYKYLHLITVHDRTVIEDVSRLETQLQTQEEELGLTMAQLQNLRQEKERELAQLRRIEGQNKRALDQFKKQQSQTATQLTAAEEAESRVTDVIARLERERVEAERRRASRGAAAESGSLTTRDLGSLNWPVEGRLIFRFGPMRKASGVTLINKGIGIAAPAGTAVKAVEGGEVVLARPFEGYGPTVMVSHGGGYYSLYMLLRSIAVTEGQVVTQGQVVGAVGGEQSPEGPHLYFQVHAPVRGNAPEAVDPLNWLRARAARQ